MKRILPFLALAALAACGGPPKQVAVPAPDTMYRQLEDPLPHADKMLLAGYKVLIDPGHGGSFRGTMGADSLEEKKVNLGVALYLWGLLREAGAEAVLTRASDRDFLTPGDSSLTSDLQARVNLADSLKPDIFISIHHNAQPARDPSMNRVETYYKAGDPASQDLAFAVHRHLMRNLGIDVGEVRQGNYYLLRKIAVPSMLGESSYLTNPGVEKKLQLSRAQELEAQAYFLGIVDYCRRGMPRVTSVSPAPVDSVQTSVPVIAAAFEDRGGIGIDPDGVSMLVNGDAVDAKLSADGKHASYSLPWDAPNGLYDVRVSARNLRGNTSPVSRTRFVLDNPPAMAAIDPSPPRIPAAGGTVRIRARVMDRRGLPMADGTTVTLVSPAGAKTRTATVRDGAVDFAVMMPSGSKRSVHVEVQCRGVKFGDDIAVDTGAMKGSRSVGVRDAVTGAAVTTASVLVADSALVSGSPSGNYGFLATNAQAMIVAPGYRPAPVAADSVKLTPWFGGVLIGKRFVLDPQGGPPRTAGVGALGLAASQVNLRVANYLADFLHNAGAEVRLARTTEEVPLAEDVARMTNQWHADYYIELRHPGGAADSAAAVRSFYFPGSAKGKQLASTIGDAVAKRLGRAHRGPSETVTYPLQQTACPAVVIALPAISNTDEEMRLAQAWYLREQAYALFVGILAMSAVPPDGTIQVDVTAADRRDWMVTLDGTWTLQTDERGRVMFDNVPPGPHDVRIRRAGAGMSRNIVTTAGQPATVAFDATH